MSPNGVHQRQNRTRALYVDASGASMTDSCAFRPAPAALGLLAAWFIVGLSGKSFEAARRIGGLSGARADRIHRRRAPHARKGAESIIEDYVHDAAQKEKALLVNKWASIAVALLDLGDSSDRGAKVTVNSLVEKGVLMVAMSEASASANVNGGL